jgi:rhodanese-related sulfurtransferase
MDGKSLSISPHDLYARLGTAAAPAIVDVRPELPAQARVIACAHRCPPNEEQRRSSAFPGDRSLVVYCMHGGEISQDAARVLRTVGIDALFLEGGFAGWAELGLPTRRMIGGTSGQWVTRERPKIDRIACPWLIARFIDPQAQFSYVPAAQVLAVAQKTGATPYDIDGVEFSHEGERCSFDTILQIYDIHDPALDHLAAIVRGADTSRHDLAPQCGGLFAISLGLSANFADDQAMLRHGMVLYDALYTWCRSLQAETHNWPPAKLVNQADAKQRPN